MWRQFALALTALLLLTGTPMTRAQPAIRGLDEADLAALTASIVNADTIHFDVALSIAGDPGLTGGLALNGTGAVGSDDAGQPLIMVETEGLFDPGGRYEVPVHGWLRLVDNSLYLRVADDDYWRVITATELEELLAGTGLPDALGGLIGIAAHDYPAWLEFLGMDLFATGTRLEGSAEEAHFRIEVDLGAWLLSPTFSDLLFAAGEASGDEFLATMGMMLVAALEGTLLTVEAGVGLDSGQMRRLAPGLEIKLDTALMPGSGSDEELAEGSLLLILDNLRYDDPFTVVAPAEENRGPA